MASQPLIEDEQDDDVLELDEPIEEQDEQPEGEPAGDDGEDFVGFADDETDEAKPDLVNTLRKQVRELTRRVHEKPVNAAPVEEPIVVGDRPKMADVDYDEDRFEEAIAAWDVRRRAAEKQEQGREAQKRRQEEDWGKVTQRYADQKAALRIPGKDEAERTTLESLSPAAQALIAKHADNAARFIVAVGLSPAKLAELARIDSEGDPFAIVKAVTKMEATLQTRKTARAPDPDTPVRGRTIAAGGADKQLAKLEAEADRTGNRTAVIAFKRAQKDAAK